MTSTPKTPATQEAAPPRPLSAETPPPAPPPAPVVFRDLASI